MKNEKARKIYFLLLKNIIIYFIIGFILISIVTFLDKIFYIKRFYEIHIILKWINNIILYILPLLLGVFIAGKKDRQVIKLKKLKLLWVLINCFFSYIIFKAAAIFILIINFIIFPLPS